MALVDTHGYCSYYNRANTMVSCTWLRRPESRPSVCIEFVVNKNGRRMGFGAIVALYEKNNNNNHQINKQKSQSLTCYFGLSFLTIPRAATNITVLSLAMAAALTTATRDHSEAWCGHCRHQTIHQHVLMMATMM